MPSEEIKAKTTPCDSTLTFSLESFLPPALVASTFNAVGLCDESRSVHVWCGCNSSVQYTETSGTPRRFLVGSDLMQTDRSVSSVALWDIDDWLVMPRDYRPEEETYSHASRESGRNGNDMFHRLTRIRLQRAIYFCLHRGSLSKNTARGQSRFRRALSPAPKSPAKNYMPAKTCARLWASVQ